MADSSCDKHHGGWVAVDGGCYAGGAQVADAYEPL
jgi:hypothetical protein